MKEFVEKRLSFSVITVRAEEVGEDCLLTVAGGGRPHIGSAVLAVPRESLRGNGEASCTSSVLNVTGHKDEEICRYLAVEVCRRRQAVTVCAGGFHMDGISEGQISEVLGALPEIVEELMG